MGKLRPGLPEGTGDLLLVHPTAHLPSSSLFCFAGAQDGPAETAHPPGTLCIPALLCLVQHLIL